jgi:hypothetical protein
VQFPYTTSGHKNVSAARTRSLLEGPPASGAYNKSGTASVAAQPAGSDDAAWWIKHLPPNGTMTVRDVEGGPCVADLVDVVMNDEFGEHLKYDSVPAAHSTCDGACR